MPQFDSAFFPAQIFWFLICFFVLWGILQWGVAPIIGALHQDRKEAVEALLQQAQDMQKTAEDLKKRDADALVRVHQEAARMISSVLHQREIQRRDCLQKLREDYSIQIQNVYYRLDQESAMWQKSHEQSNFTPLVQDFLHTLSREVFSGPLGASLVKVGGKSKKPSKPVSDGPHV